MNTDITNLEYQIRQSVKYDNGCEVSFEYDKSPFRFLFGNKIQVRAFTFNPSKKETFLLKEVTCTSVEEGLKKILNYVEKGKKDYNSFTVKWYKKGSGSAKREASYFYCKSVKDAILKFYFNKDEDEYIVESVDTNPIA